MLYAVRWVWCLLNSDLRLAHQSLLSYNRLRKSSEDDPATWESVLRSLLALLEASEPGLGIREQISLECAMFSVFDLYARG